MGLLLDMSPRDLEKILYFAAFVVTDPKETPLEYKQLLYDKELRECQEKYGDDAFCRKDGCRGCQGSSKADRS